MQKVIAFFLFSLFTACYAPTTYAKKKASDNDNKNEYITCGTCGDTSPQFKEEEELIEHIKKEHPEIDTKKSNYRKKTPDGKFICAKCEDHPSLSEAGLYVHINDKHLAIRYNCQNCNQAFIFKSGLQKHLRKKSCKKKAKYSYKKIDKNWSYACGTCDKKSPLFKDEEELLEHIKEKHPEIDTDQSNYTEKTSNNKYICTKCKDYSPASRNGVLYHVQDKHILIKYRCSLCNENFSRKCDVRRHLKNNICKKNAAESPSTEPETNFAIENSNGTDNTANNASTTCCPLPTNNADNWDLYQDPILSLDLHQEPRLAPVAPIAITSTDPQPILPPALKIQQALKALFNFTPDVESLRQNICSLLIDEYIDSHGQKHHKCLFLSCDKNFPNQNEALYHILKYHFLLEEAEINQFLSQTNSTENQPVLFSLAPEEDVSYMDLQ